MSATALQRVDQAEPAIDPVYISRDDLAQSFNPANGHERMLVTAAAQAWQRLQRAYDMERRLLETTDLLDLFKSDPDAFKSMARHIAECERIWRRALEALERVQRATAKAAKTQTASPRPRAVATAAPPPRPLTLQAHETAAAAAATRAAPAAPGLNLEPAELLKLT